MKKDFLTALTEFVAIPSVSTDAQYEPDIMRATQWLSTYCIQRGLTAKTIMGYQNPIIVAKTPHVADLPTILVYGHYDVQPATKADGWTQDPFIVTRKKDALYARGIADNKAQIFCHIYSVAELMREKTLAYNVIFLIEGNEETGSYLLEKFVAENKKLIACDCILVSDGELMNQNRPCIEIGFRGSANFIMTLETGTQDMHSGLFGGVVPNAAEELGKILGKITDFTGKKNGYRSGSTANAASLKKFEKRRTLKQTVEVTGLSSGYTSAGFRNSIPYSATAKINIRSAPNQDIQKLLRNVQMFLKKQAPTYVKVHFINDQFCHGCEFDIDNTFAKKAINILKKVYGQKPGLKTSGGSLPIASIFKRILRVPQIMIPIGDSDCGAHSAREHMSVDVIEKGLVFSSAFFGGM